MKKQTIKLVRVTKEGQKEVFPKKSAAMNCFPLFLVNTDRGEKWVSIPGVTVEEIYETWAEQVRNRKS